MRIETAAMTSGTSARNEAKTKIRTTSAPAAPSRVSVSTPGPDESPPADSMPYDVSPLVKPLPAAAWSRAGSICVSMPGPKDVGIGALDQGVRRPAVVGEEALVPRARVVDQARVRAARSPCVAKTFSIAAWLPWTVWPSGTVTVPRRTCRTSSSRKPEPCAARPCRPAARAARSPGSAGRTAGRRQCRPPRRARASSRRRSGGGAGRVVRNVPWRSPALGFRWQRTHSMRQSSTTLMIQQVNLRERIRVIPDARWLVSAVICGDGDGRRAMRRWAG